MEYVHHNRTEDDDGEARRFFTRRRSRSVSSSEEVTKVDDNLFPPRKRRPPTGHELDRINDHISLEHFGKQLQKAANAIFPDDGERASKYTRVDVILLSWKDEDPKLPVSVEVAALAHTFEDVYGHNVEHWLIPSEESHIKLQGKILQFLGDNDPAHLKIVYYAGHGRLTNHGQPAWTRYVLRISKWSQSIFIDFRKVFKTDEKSVAPPSRQV
jgi:hypothetical protein